LAPKRDFHGGGVTRVGESPEVLGRSGPRLQDLGYSS
jgi:hypothetical protein